METYRAMRPALVSYVNRIVRSTADAEDIVQGTFLRAFHYIQENKVDNLRNWLYRVAHNLAIDALRKNGLHNEIWLQETQHAPATRDVSPEEGSIRNQFLERALKSLNERERACLLLRAEGLSYAEVGEVVGISAKAVSVYLARAVKKVRKSS